MLVFLAESKTMSADQHEITKEEFSAHMPVFESSADVEMSLIARQSATSISEILGISHALSVKALKYAYDFPNKSLGYKALKGFTGEAFKGLMASTLSDEALERANHNLRIISSLYGILNPDDIIKPYRLEFNKNIFSDNSSAIKTYKQKVTVEVVKYIKENSIKEIIDLLPADADKCIDWKIVRAYAKVYKIRFQSISSDGSLKTPLAKRLKELRGLMTRAILENNFENFQQLCNFESPHYVFSPHDSKEGLPIFICDA